MNLHPISVGASRRPPAHASWRRLAPFLSLTFFILIVLYRLTLLGGALYWGDLFLYFYPLASEIRESLLAGRLPLWNPYVLCGQPLIGNPQSCVFYPTSALLVFLPVWLSFTLNTILHLLLAGAGTYLFLRRLCGDRLGAVLGAIVFTGSGFVIARLQFPTMVQSIAWLPWILLLVDRMVDRPRIGYGALLASVVALEILAAHTQIAFMTFACGAVYALARLWHIRRHSERVRLAVGGMASAFAIGVLAASAQLLPAFQLLPYSTREHLTWTQANRFTLLPEQLVNFMLPSFYGHPASGDYWGEGNAWESCVYLGLVPLVLSVFAVRFGSRRAAVRFFTLTGLIALWLAMGRYGGLYWLAYYIVPGLSSFHDPARFTFLTTFALAVLSAIGMRSLRDRHVPGWWRLALVLVSAVNLWWFGARYNPAIHPTAFRYRPRAMAIVPRSGDGRVFTAQREQVWKRYVDEADYGPESARYAHEVSDTLSPNIGIRFGVEEASGYEPVPVRAVTEMDAVVRKALSRQAPNLATLLGMFNAQLLLLPQSMRYHHLRLTRKSTRGVTALAVRDPWPRAWLVRRTRRVDGARRALAVLGDPGFDPWRIAVVSDGEGLPDPDNTTSQNVVHPVRILESANSRFRAVVDAGSGPAFLVWSAAWYPGWVVTVDERPSHIVRTNHAFMGVTIPAGRHRVVFHYRPFVVRVSLFLSLLGGGLISAGLAYGAVTRRPLRRFSS